MQFYKECFLITFILSRTISEVQGKKDVEFLRYEGQGNSFLQNRGTGKYFKQQDIKNLQRYSKKNMLTTADDVKSPGIPIISKERRLRYTAAKSFYSEVSPIMKNSIQEINTKENLNVNLPIRRSFPTQKIYCRQITKSEINSQGNIIESIHHICAPAVNDTPAGFSTPAAAYVTFENVVTTTPKGINCRRVMNSEFNELGEIVDSVTEVCDPAPTTTRKPIINTTTKVATTTPKPLVKICGPVMDSYLNEMGKIIDSVNIVCKMVTAT